MATNRRDFIRTAGVGLMAATLPGYMDLHAKTVQHQLSVQLYTIRDAINNDFEGSLKQLASIGFKNVETAFWPKEITDEHAAAVLKSLGLKISSCHTDIPTKDNIAKLAALANGYNCKTIIWHGWPEDKRHSTLEGTRELISIYNKANKLAKDNGLRFGLHNHWWEYRNHVGGKLVYEILHEELDADIFFETDVYWVKVAGQNPATILQKLKNRIRFIHLKDGPAEFNDKLLSDSPDPMTPLGQGTQNIPAIINASSANVEYMVLELDKSIIDVFDALKQSYDYLAKFRSVNRG
ncbi:sugar phosphate isomerase/epimerase family protein [Mucilaginibacter pedocola]|uniref:Xylose isomerase-like TIM barrel domain-containing protein n=1 Tax=Mucilaginibacter pedocola TaxID=1792845 RepID=A0A1S9P9C3_9SPHI|nr:sugar phosphate isomerase/epimerase [Mucilaginibacter pedocola]OOQ57178.1 hypothetical protein BC343_16800 [Mucilaginibacter pedocola]